MASSACATADTTGVVDLVTGVVQALSPPAAGSYAAAFLGADALALGLATGEIEVRRVRDDVVLRRLRGGEAPIRGLVVDEPRGLLIAVAAREISVFDARDERPVTRWVADGYISSCDARDGRVVVGMASGKIILLSGPPGTQHEAGRR